MNESLFFTCEEIDLNPRTSWAELLQIAFINKEQYFSISRLAYEEELYFEYNEQTHYIYALCQDVEFNLKANALYIHITKPLKSNCPFSTITIQLPSTPISLEEVLQHLKSNN
ncbi:transcriptional regulator [Capnocytophaga leadbetteri]|uniref:transcriptional regulator n=1 Tax=Capnocytophaga leadbetteri TaxID=327575 RepID=UPI0026EC6D14|nr:transcriptional regulator [Capnocytophaga leadbetteri]